MDKHTFTEKIIEIFHTSQYNHIPADKALSNNLVSVKMFDEPVVGITSADNPMFGNLQSDGVIGKHFVMPSKWLPEAKSVISFFFPFTEAIRAGNRLDKSCPSNGWMHGRIEGQYFLNKFIAAIASLLSETGYKTLVPTMNKRFLSSTGIETRDLDTMYTSNWSERHIGYVCGLGTFSLSKGLITEKGMAGRMTSIITELELTPDTNTYRKYDENCIMCGKCIDNCPVNAISFEHGKNHELCSNFLDSVLSKNSPWYGCGKCQVGVPCEYSNPRKNKED